MNSDMKRLNQLMGILLACMMSVALSGCTTEDGGGITPAPQKPLNVDEMIGTWQCIFSVDTYMGQSQQGLMVGQMVTINKDGTYTSTSADFGLSGTYTVAGNTVSAQSSAGSFTMNVRIDGNNMHWSGTSPSGVIFEYNFVKVKGKDTGVNVIDTGKFVGTWTCVYSIDVNDGELFKGLMVDKQVSIRDDGTYTSTSSDFGASGTYTVQGDVVRAKSSAGTFTLTPWLSDQSMTWAGYASNGVRFLYIFQKE